MTQRLKLVILGALAVTSWLGISAFPSVSKGADFFSNITYTWRENGEGAEHSATLDQIATDPDQIIAMLREVYMNRTIPGIYTRGYDRNENSEGGWTVDQNGVATSVGTYPVNYGGVGSFSNRSYRDDYGWNIPISSRNNISDYVPYEEGYTLLLVEMQDHFETTGNNSYPTVNSYQTLRTAIANTVKSVRIITENARRYTGDEAESKKLENGTWFKIDCDKMNRFFIISKGKPCYYSGSRDYIYRSYLYHMFEQFSPSIPNKEAASNVYTRLINMEPFPVYHDCPSVPYASAGHEFNMLSGPDASDEEVANAPIIRDLMFFVPDYRLLYHTNKGAEGEGRDPSSNNQRFFRYNLEHAPVTELFVIHLNAIDGEQVEVDGESEHCYKLDLTWNSNLKEFLPQSNGKYELFRVIIDSDGTKHYEKVVEKNPVTGEPILDADGNTIPVIMDLDQLNYTDYVPMLTTGQQVTYVVRGRDVDEFLSLQYSNEQSYLIPGYDKRELLTLRIDADHYSRFDPVEQKNLYWNAIPMSNNVGTNVTQNFLSDGKDGKAQSEFIFVRKLSIDDPNPTIFAIAKVVEKNKDTGKCKFSIKMVDSTQETFEGCMENKTEWEFSYPVDEDDPKVNEVDFNDFVIYDNFSASTKDNEQPAQYVYQVQFEAAEAFKLEDGSPSTEVFSNNKRVDTHKTVSMISGGISKDDVDGDNAMSHKATDHVEYSILLKPGSPAELTRYNVNRWLQGTTPSVEHPIGYAENHGGSYSLTLGDWSTDVLTTTAAWGKFIDNTAAAPGEYSYVPQIQVYRYPGDKTRSDLNTYGAPILTTALAQMTLEAHDPEVIIDADGNVSDYSLMSNYKWQKDDKWYSYYNIFLDIKDLQIPAGFEIYKLRAWRKVEGYTGTENNRTQVDNVLGECLDTRAPRTVIFDTGDAELGAGWYMYEDMNFGNNLDVDGLTTMRLSTLSPRGTNYYIIGDRSTSIAKPDGEKLFEDQTGEWAYGDSQNDAIRNEKRATFGALRLKTDESDIYGTLDELNAKFVVRVYFTKVSEPRLNGPRKAESDELVSLDDKYYIAEYQCEYNAKAGTSIVTGVSSIGTDCEVSGVVYYNTLGLPSVTPWQGVNIVVTRYSDGTTTTTKIIK